MKDAWAMENRQITEAQYALLNLIGHSLFSMPLNLKTDIDWRAVASEAHAQSVLLLAFKDYPTLGMDEKLKQSLKAYFKKCTAANINCYNGHKHLHALLESNGIPYCIFKGPVSAGYYPDPMLRIMGDVDFYVTKENYERTKGVLLAHGYEILGDEDLLQHVTFHKATAHLELHVAPVAVPNENMRPLFLEYWSDICERASVVKDDFGEYVFPSAFHHGFILLTHFQKHLFFLGVGLRHLCDWAVFVNSFSNDSFVDLFEKRFKRAGLWRFAQVLSLIAVKHFGMEHKPWMGDDYAVADALLEDILRGGNFGKHADDGRKHEHIFVSHSQTSGARKSRLLTMFRNINAIVKSKWRIVEKCPLLYPVGWVYFPLNFLFRVLCGRARMNFFQSYKYICN